MWSNKQWKRKYTYEQNRRRYLDESTSYRRQVIGVFCNAVETAIVGLKDDQEFTPGFRYVGYAMNAASRREQHGKTGSSSTNWLGSLILAICHYYWTDWEYKLEFHILILLGAEVQATVAEQLMAVIGQTYFWTGRGINIAHCGNSVASVTMSKKTEAERKVKNVLGAMRHSSTSAPTVWLAIPNVTTRHSRTRERWPRTFLFFVDILQQTSEIANCQVEGPNGLVQTGNKTEWTVMGPIILYKRIIGKVDLRLNKCAERQLACSATREGADAFDKFHDSVGNIYSNAEVIETSPGSAK
jgi:hypothetical protein